MLLQWVLLMVEWYCTTSSLMKLLSPSPMIGVLLLPCHFAQVSFKYSAILVIMLHVISSHYYYYGMDAFNFYTSSPMLLPDSSVLESFSWCILISGLADGHPTLVTGSASGHLAFWNLESRSLLSQTLEAHHSGIGGLICLPNEPIMVTSAADNALKVAFSFPICQNFNSWILRS